jgi:hypothetical protein
VRAALPWGKSPGTHWIGGWVADAVAKRKNPSMAPVGSRTPIVQPVAWLLRILLLSERLVNLNIWLQEETGLHYKQGIQCAELCLASTCTEPTEMTMKQDPQWLWAWTWGTWIQNCCMGVWDCNGSSVERSRQRQWRQLSTSVEDSEEECDKFILHGAGYLLKSGSSVGGH